jgi:hypothetical protein
MASEEENIEIIRGKIQQSLDADSKVLDVTGTLTGKAGLETGLTREMILDLLPEKVVEKTKPKTNVAADEADVESLH